jgi:putative transposase
MAQGSREHGVPVHASMLMTNHVHLIVTPHGARELARFVKSFAQRYAQFRNRSRKSSGKLFEERYKCKPIRTEAQMAVTVTYIELNPVRAGICEDPGAYPWSTYLEHAGAASAEPLLTKLWQPSAWYTSLGLTAEARAAAYLYWFEHYRVLDDWSQVHADPKHPRDRKRFERPNRRQAT